MLSIKNLSKQYGSKILFEGAEAHFGPRSRVALIGPNGAGKSTIFKLLMDEEHPDSGEVARSGKLRIGHLAQEVPRFEGRSVLSEVMRLDGRREELIASRAELEERLARLGENIDPEDLERYGMILESVEDLDEARLEARAKEILTGMGFALTDFQRSLSEFSGGWLMRVALSRILLLEPELLLLDEPTNHLDLESLLWLEEFLMNYRGAMLVISHDRAFLNRLANEVLEIDVRKLWHYNGNLDAWELQKVERLKQQSARYESQQARIAEIHKFVDRFGAKATKARQAQSKLKEIDRMDLVDAPEARESVRFRFPPAPHSGREVMTLKKAGLSYGKKTVFKGLDWVLQRGSRVAIVGRNGAGKTTLLKLIAGELEATEGLVKPGHLVQVGFYAQHQADKLNLAKSITQELEDLAPDMPIARIRAIAGAFLFTGDAVHKKCGILSGGEKARVALAKLLLSPSNFLLLDEPTNHLDIESKSVLLEALQGYEGTLCLVSHDRDFVSPLVTSVLEIVPHENASELVHWIGTYDDYLAKLEERAHEAAKAGRPGKSLKAAAKQASASGKLASPSKVTAPNKTTAPNQSTSAPSAPDPSNDPVSEGPGPSNNQRRAWQKERETIESEIAKIDRRIGEVHRELGDSATYQDKEKSQKLGSEEKDLQGSLMAKMARWEELENFLGGGAS